jgi:O-antigen ligase
VFWTPEREQEAVRTIGFNAGSSHSIYLENLLNTGLLGLALFILLLATGFTMAFSMPPPDAVFLASFVFFVAMHGLFESTFAIPNFRSFAFFLLIFAMS